MKEQLARLESQIQTLVEGSLARLLGAEVSAPELALQLARAMDEGVRLDSAGRPHAPDQYALALNPHVLGSMGGQAEAAQELGRGLLDAARSAGYLLGREPQITLASDPTLPRWQARVVAWHSNKPLEYTQAMAAEESGGGGRIPPGAFLIVDGKRHFPLDRPVASIGRRLDNQLVLEDVHASRNHAQIRLREGRFVVFDLGSTSGTFVNGRPVKQHILRPGDVITIGSVRLVYGEDPGGTTDATPAYPRPREQRNAKSGPSAKDMPEDDSSS